MKGSLSVPFSSLFADTVACHGAAWARRHYMRAGMPAWEFRFWLRALRGV